MNMGKVEKNFSFLHLLLTAWDDHPKLDPDSVTWVKLPPVAHLSTHR